MTRTFGWLGAVSAAIAVAAGAFGAHALRARLEPRHLEVFETAARYQMYHALALLAVAALMPHLNARGAGAARASGWLFLAGTVLFSGSLYAIALADIGAFGAVAPLGGAAFIAGWVSLAVALSRTP